MSLPILDELAEVLAPDESEEDLVEKILTKDAINSFLATLSPDVRKIFVQRYWYCRQIKEIAKDFGKSESHLRVLLHRTRLAFKTHLERQNVRL